MKALILMITLVLIFLLLDKLILKDLDGGSNLIKDNIVFNEDD